MPMLFHDLGVGELRQAATAVFLRRRHAEYTEATEASDDVRRNLGIAVDGGGVDVFFGIATHLVHGAGGFFVLFTAQRGIGKQQRGVEMAEEQTLGEAKRLRTGEKEFFGLLTLFIDLRGGESHSDPRGKNNDSPQRHKGIRSRKANYNSLILCLSFVSLW
jgi:hypothetical protein